MRDDEGSGEAGRDAGFEAELGRQVGSDRRGTVPGRGRVLLIGEGAETGRPLVLALAREGFAVRLCADARTGLQSFLCDLPDLIVMHARASDPDGLALLRDIRAISDVPVVLVGGRAGDPARDGAFGLGCARVVRASEDADEVARRAAEIVAEPVDGADGALGGSTAPERAPGRRRLTAAQVRQIARVELAAELERQLIDCRGNLAEMARRMGKDRSTIRYHLRRLGMLVEDRTVRPEHEARAAGDSNRPPV